jgi:putative FmdB family regulatory protein
MWSEIGETMPVFEYSCLDCKKRFSMLEGVGQNRPDRACPKCKSRNLKKLISLFSRVKSEESRLEALTDPSSLSGVDENDPKSIAKWAKKMGKELGEDMGDDLDELIDGDLETTLSEQDDTTY